MGIAGPVGAPGTGRPTVRNALMTFLIPVGLIVVGNILGTILVLASGIAELSYIGQLLSLAGAVLAIIAVVKMINELKAVTGNASFPWWPMFVPFYGMYWAWIMVPGEVAKAKQMRGIQNPPRGIVVYVFLFLYALAADLNDIANAP